MGQYADRQQEAQEALERRQFHRRRLLRGVRGLWREVHKPWRLAVRSLLLAALPGLLAGFGACAAGLSPWGPSPAIGFLVLWLGYDALMRQASERLGRDFDFWQHFEEGIAIDDVEESRVNRGIVGALEERFTPETVQAIRGGAEQGWRSGLERDPAGSLLVLILLGCLSGGVWLVWKLIETAPGLLAGIIVDDSVRRRHPQLEWRVEFIEKWHRETYVASSVYFWALAAVALIFGTLLWFGLQLGKEQSRNRQVGCIGVIQGFG